MTSEELRACVWRGLRHRGSRARPRRPRGAAPDGRRGAAPGGAAPGCGDRGRAARLRVVAPPSPAGEQCPATAAEEEPRVIGPLATSGSRTRPRRPRGERRQAAATAEQQRGAAPGRLTWGHRRPQGNSARPIGRGGVARHRAAGHPGELHQAAATAWSSAHRGPCSPTPTSTSTASGLDPRAGRSTAAAGHRHPPRLSRRDPTSSNRMEQAQRPRCLADSKLGTTDGNSGWYHRVISCLDEANDVALLILAMDVPLPQYCSTKCLCGYT
ncbi:hypothetical protein BS78_01G242000 [Paspalum vaginatum]|nr:hypothetical protein BS78_01G242000 [Paspalum vaginatum]